MSEAGRSTVVVTGGAGFIGSELVRQLAARGDRVVAIDNLVNGTRENLADVLSDRVTERLSSIVSAIAARSRSIQAAGTYSGNTR